MSEPKTSLRQAKKEESNLESFLRIAGYEPGKPTRFVSIEELKEQNKDLIFNNGGPWCRFDGSFGKKYKAVKVFSNLRIQYSWDPEDDEKQAIGQEVSQFPKKKVSGNPIAYLKVVGEKSFEQTTRAIRKDIRDVLIKQPCVVCGSSSSLEIDHKNGLYNNPRVLNLKTQVVEDFQTLCKHCNDQKRQTYKWQTKHNKRYPAELIPMLAALKISYTEGNETLNKDDPDAMIGTFWYDPVAFLSSCKKS